MQQVLLRYGLDSIDQNEWEVDHFWKWPEFFRLDAQDKTDESNGEKNEGQQKIRLLNTQIFVASNFRITTRRLKMVKN